MQGFVIVGCIINRGERRIMNMTKNNNNKNKGLIITIVIMGIALIGLGGYLTYDKLLSNNNDKNTGEKESTKTDEVEEKEGSVNKEEQEKLLKVINDINNYNLGRYDNLNPSEINNQDKLVFISYVIYNNKLNGEDKSIAGLNGSEVNSIYQTYFGSTQSVVNGDIYMVDYTKYGLGEDNEVLFKYNNTKNVYEQEKFYMAPPGYALATTYSFIANATKKDGVYTVEVQTLYATPCEDLCLPDGIIAGSYKDAVDKKNAVLTDNSGWYDDNYNIIQSKVYEDYNKIKDKMPVYTYTFVLENGHYVLQSKTMEAK